MTSDDGFIIDLLIKKNVATDIAVQSAREAIEEEGNVVTATTLLERLTDDLNLPTEQVLLMLSEEFNMEMGHVNEVLLADEIKEFFPYTIVQKYKIFPIAINDAEAEIAISDNYDEDVDNAVAGITSIIEPIMIVFLALAVGFIVIALFLPIVEIIKELTG